MPRSNFLIRCNKIEIEEITKSASLWILTSKSCKKKCKAGKKTKGIKTIRNEASWYGTCVLFYEYCDTSYTLGYYFVV